MTTSVIWKDTRFSMLTMIVSFIIQSPSNAQECTLQQPYPWLPTSICSGWGISCPKSSCNASPGTPGRWDVNGRYNPKIG
jgi:hypothetical protein